MEPTMITSNYTNDPITPLTKIVKPSNNHNNKAHHHKVIDPSNSIPNHKDSLSNKFLLKTIDSGDDANLTRSLIPIMTSDTPTRKRSKSQEKEKSSLSSKKSRYSELGPSPPLANLISPVSPPSAVDQSKLNGIKIVKPPAKFQPFKESLVDSSIKEYDQLKEVFSSNSELAPDLRKEYLSISKLNSNDWIARGFENVNKSYELIHRIIFIRLELSMKFDKVFQIINKYGEHLESNDRELNEKMQRLQKLGEEIKNFIK